MRKLFAASMLLLPFGLGCQHVGGECDCAPIPGDSRGHNPHVTHHATTPGGIAPTVVSPRAPVSAGKGDGFEPIGPPKVMPKVKH
ncbi:MAG: hypothetical protein EXS09_02110 [Gemmataceae bacterium]|nr:hypothetical protein [Gemmataceae bacterium]